MTYRKTRALGDWTMLCRVALGACSSSADDLVDDAGRNNHHDADLVQALDAGAVDGNIASDGNAGGAPADASQSSDGGSSMAECMRVRSCELENLGDVVQAHITNVLDHFDACGGSSASLIEQVASSLGDPAPEDRKVINLVPNRACAH